MELRTRVFIRVTSLVALLMILICAVYVSFLVWQHRGRSIEALQHKTLDLAKHVQQLMAQDVPPATIQTALEQCLHSHPAIEYVLIERGGKTVHEFAVCAASCRQIGGHNVSTPSALGQPLDSTGNVCNVSKAAMYRIFGFIGGIDGRTDVS